MLKIYYDRFTETCHNIFKSLIFFLPSFLFLFLVSIFSNIQKHSFFLAPFSRHSLTFRSSFACRLPAVCLSSARPSLVLRSSFTHHLHCSHAVCVSSALSARRLRAVHSSFAHRPCVLRTVRMSSACCLHCLRVVREQFARPPCTIPELSARHPRTIRELSMRPPRTVRASSLHRAPFALLMLLFFTKPN